MRKLVASRKRAGTGPSTPRVFKVNLERFAHFGDAGTPAGMITCRSATLVVGSCGAADEAVAMPALGPEASQSSLRMSSVATAEAAADQLGVEGWGPPPSGLDEGSDDDGVPVARVGVLEWMPTLVYGAASPEPIDVEPPTAKIELPTHEVGAPLVAREHERSAEVSGPEPLAGAPDRKGWRVVAGAVVLGLVLALGWVAGRGEPAAAADEPLVAAGEQVAVGEAPPPPDLPAGIQPNDDLEEIRVDAPVVDEPEPEPEPEAAPPEPAPRRRKPLAHETKQCAEARLRTTQASTAGQWREVLTLTAKTKCWAKADKVEPQAARMVALFELGRPGECVEVGKGSNHPKIVTLRKRCTFAQK
ncbi:hypothetical protein [Enhygromyxa salina]|nr:hypothetical protein [Enhygromyxa salina]